LLIRIALGYARVAPISVVRAMTVGRLKSTEAVENVSRDVGDALRFQPDGRAAG